MKRLILIFALFIGCVWGVGAQTPTPTPTPPPHKPFILDWDDNPAGEGVKWYNVYKHSLGIYIYQATVYVPAPSQWTIPLTTPRNTVFAVTADDGNLESGFSLDATVPLGPTTPISVKVTITFP